MTPVLLDLNVLTESCSLYTTPLQQSTCHFLVRFKSSDPVIYSYKSYCI